jgi:putative membrane-bound dehydrogenase-like protein
LLWAAGVAPWKGGVFVAAPPDIWYLKDTDGDLKADVRERVVTGFGTQNQQAMLNNQQWWLDGRIYGSTAGNGGTIRTVDRPGAPPVRVDGRDFRFDPESRRFEAITRTVQFGNTFDDWGDRFVCSESQPLLHVVFPEEALARNPYVQFPRALNNLAPPPVPIFRISPIERWRQIRTGRRIAVNARPATSAGASHHVVDAAAGVTIYRGGAYPPEMYASGLAGKQEEVRQAPGLQAPEDDFLRYFAAVVRGEVKPSGLSSLRNNVIVVEILDAARRSAATGRAIRLS